MSSRAVVYAMAALLGLGVGLWIAFELLAPSLVESAYRGTSLDYINQLLQRHRQKDLSRDLDFYLSLAHSVGSRLFILYFILLGLCWFGLTRARRRLRSFFTSTSHPVNLGVCRIILFWQVLASNFAIPSQPEQRTLVMPPGWGWAADILPVGADTYSTATFIFTACCGAALLGLWTRLVIPCATLLGLYVMGLPQFFGKIDHYHFLWWFMVILSVSPCSDALSVDALWRSLRTAELPRPSRAYGLPLRLIWLLIGLLYFFPGFWKYVLSGSEWALSENLKFKMYAKWFELDGFRPLIRVDEYPLLYQSGAVGTILFELGFLFALLFPLTRAIFVVWGLLFHQITRMLMNISFSSLVWMYVVFVDWHALFSCVGRLLFPSRLVITYDPNSTAARQRVALLQACDLLDTVAFEGLPGGSGAAAGRSLTLANGANAWTAILVRVPLALLAAPMLLVAQLRDRPPFADSSELSANLPAHRLWPTASVGAFLLVLNGAFGLALVDSWPFAVYPTFAAIEEPYLPALVMAAYDEEGKQIAEIAPHREAAFRSSFVSGTRLYGYIKNILADSNAGQAERKMRSLWGLWKATDERVRGARRIRFYRAVFSTVPEHAGAPYRQRQLLLEFPIGKQASQVE